MVRAPLSKKFETHAFDVSSSAREMTSLNAPGVIVHESKDSIAPGEFDLVTSLHVLEHIPSPAEVLRLIVSFLKPGGRLLVVVPNLNGLGRHIQREDWFAHRDPTRCTLLTIKEWIGLIEDADSRLDRIGTERLGDFPYKLLLNKPLQFPVLGSLAGLQVLTGRLLFPANWGECLVVVAAKTRSED